MKIKFSSRFFERIQEVPEFFIPKILEKIDILKEFPYIGTPMENKVAREFLLFFNSKGNGYRVSYKVYEKEEKILILSIKYNKQNDY